MPGPKIPSYFRIFKGKEPDSFSYRPRYYDQEKEEREQRRKAIEQEVKGMESEGGYDTEAFRQRIRDRWKHQNVQGETKRANLRLLIIFALLCMLVYFIYKYLEQV